MAGECDKRVADKFLHVMATDLHSLFNTGEDSAATE